MVYFSQKWVHLIPLKTGMEGEPELYLVFGPLLTAGNHRFLPYKVVRETGHNEYESVVGETALNIRNTPVEAAMERIKREMQRQFVIPRWVYEKEPLFRYPYW